MSGETTETEFAVRCANGEVGVHYDSLSPHEDLVRDAVEWLNDGSRSEFYGCGPHSLTRRTITYSPWAAVPAEGSEERR